MKLNGTTQPMYLVYRVLWLLTIAYVNAGKRNPALVWSISWGYLLGVHALLALLFVLK